MSIKQAKLSSKLIIRIFLISVIGLIISFVIINYFVRNAIYENIINTQRSEMTVYANEIDAWFARTHSIVNNMSALYQSMSRDNAADIGGGFSQANSFVELAYIGTSGRTSDIEQSLYRFAGYLERNHPPMVHCGQSRTR
jgi:hypothetical protein